MAAPVVPRPPATVDGVILPGWMPHEFAIPFLLNDCVFDPPLTERGAEEIWQSYKAAVDNLPERAAPAPPRLPFTPAEQNEVNNFLQAMRQRGAANILDVIKIDVRLCVAHQLIVVTERSRTYVQRMNTPQAKLHHCLGLHAAPHNQFEIAAAAPNAVNIRIPHAEFIFTLLQPGGFAVQELAKHINTTAFDGRLLLWSGYHRSFALMTNEYPDGRDRSLVTVLSTDADFLLSPQDSPNQGLRDIVRGLRPPLFGDFFDERFFIPVRLRKKRCELWIRAQTMWLNADE
jgi:hypothetical protein